MSNSSGLIYFRASYREAFRCGLLSHTRKIHHPGSLPGHGQHPSYTQSVSLCFEQPSSIHRSKWGNSSLLAIAGIGFVAGAIFDAYQQTEGFKNFCKFDALEMLVWGAGGAIAATAATLFVISGVGFVSMGMQGVALSLSGYAATSSLATSIWIAGTSTVGASAVAMSWLLTGNN